ncbi:isochorismatase family protein [Micromonospora sp. SCSIO 07396]
MAGLPTIEPYPLPAVGDLPGNTAGWKFDPARAALLIHDMQRYFLGPLPAPQPRDQLIGNIAALREFSVQNGLPVFYTAQPGGMSDQERGLLHDFWGPGMRVDPADRHITARLAPGPHDRVLTKRRYSAFFRTDLLDQLRGAGRDQLIISGVYAHVGVLVTAIDAFTHDIQPFLVGDAVADFSAEHHRQALRYAADRCAVVLTTEGVTNA